MRSKVVIIGNRNAGTGITQACMDDLRNQALHHYDSVDTFLPHTPPQTATAVLQNLQPGYSFSNHAVIVGGDGTFNAAVQGYMKLDERVRKRKKLSLINAGTGGDFNRMLGGSRSITDHTIDEIVRGEVRPIDIMKATWIDDRGNRDTQYAINVIGLGINGDVSERANALTKKTQLTYSIMSVKSLIGYNPVQVDINGTYANGAPFEWSDKILSGFVANGMYCGNGMNIAPQANLEDGFVDVALIGDLGKLRPFFHLSKLKKGKMTKIPKLRTARLRELSVMPKGVMPIDIDGEHYAITELRIEVLPKAVNVVFPHSKYHHS